MHKHVDTLPLVGHSRWSQIAPFVGVCRETWRQLCKAGRAPQPIHLSPRCTVWNNAESHVYLRDPLGYRDPGFVGEGASDAWPSADIR